MIENAADHQSPVTSHQPPATSHQPPVTSLPSLKNQFLLRPIDGESAEGLSCFFQKLFRRREGFLSQSRAHDVFAGAGIIQRLVVMEIEAERFGDRIQLMVFHVWPELHRERDGVAIAKVQVGEAVGSDRRGEDAHVEAGIVREDHLPFEMLSDFFEKKGKVGLLCHVGGGDAVYFLTFGVEIHVERVDEMVPLVDDFFAIAGHDAEGAGVRRSPVGGFKIDCNVVHDD